MRQKNKYFTVIWYVTKYVFFLVIGTLIYMIIGPMSPIIYRHTIYIQVPIPVRDRPCSAICVYKQVDLATPDRDIMFGIFGQRGTIWYIFLIYALNRLFWVTVSIYIEFITPNILFNNFQLPHIQFRPVVLPAIILIYRAYCLIIIVKITFYYYTTYRRSTHSRSNYIA